MEGTPLKRMTFRTKIKEYFLTGILVLIPAVVTIWVFKTVLDFVDGFFSGLPDAYQPRTYVPIPGVGVVIGIVLIIVVGAFARNTLGTYAYHYGDRFLSRIPFFRAVYKALKQLLGTVVSSPTQNFRQVLLLEYPRKGIYTLAFLTGQSKGEIADVTHKPMLNVFVPTAPNPTSGYLLVVPEDEVIPLKMPVEDAFKVILSGGMVSPDEDDVIGKHFPPPVKYKEPKAKKAPAPKN